MIYIYDHHICIYNIHVHDILGFWWSCDYCEVLFQLLVITEHLCACYMMLYDFFFCMILYPEGDNAFDHPLLAALPKLQAQRHCVLAGNGNWWAAGSFVQHNQPMFGKTYVHAWRIHENSWRSVLLVSKMEKLQVLPMRLNIYPEFTIGNPQSSSRAQLCLCSALAAHSQFCFLRQTKRRSK